jgi:carboxypeptidase C (cathepsin A)
MDETVSTRGSQPGEPFVDRTPYGCGKHDSISDTTEYAAISEHSVVVNGISISYTATAGHLVAADPYSAQPVAKIFYVAFTANNTAPSKRPMTFFYNGGPGSSSSFLLLGSFGPRRIKTCMPSFTPPAPYAMQDNPDSLLDHTDLVFINPVGTGYSAAIAPNENVDFWGVDQDARCIKAFIKRYLTVYGRWNSPKFLFGESYGTPRTCVLTWLLHEDGVDLSGVVLQSAILDYSQSGNPVGLLPTLAADAWVHQKVTVSPPPADVGSFVDQQVIPFARTQYAGVQAEYARTRTVGPQALKFLSEILGIDPILLKHWNLDPSGGGGNTFLTSLLQDAGYAVGAYDGRVTSVDTGIAGSVDSNSGGNDPTITAVGGAITAMCNVYLNEELNYTATAPFMDLNDQAFLNWDFGHIDPTGTQRGGNNVLYTAGDLAASMALNPYLKVFVASGYYDAVTPFFQTVLDLEKMPLLDERARENLVQKRYPSGHMIYFDDDSRTAMKHDLADFYKAASTPSSTEQGLSTRQAVAAADEVPALVQSRYRRRFSGTPY